jgi:hypothetical protein
VRDNSREGRSTWKDRGITEEMLETSERME